MKIQTADSRFIPVKDRNSNKKYHENCSTFPHCTYYRKPLQDQHFATEYLRKHLLNAWQSVSVPTRMKKVIGTVGLKIM